MYINPNINHLYRVGNAHSRKGCLRLDMNENPEGLPRKFVDHVLAQITPEFLASYPEKQPAIQALASYYQIGENQLDLFNGSDEAIRLIFETFADPEKKILASDPTFAMYGVYAKMFGLEYETVSYDTSFQFPTDDFIRRIDDRTSLIFTLNPNNPIGTAFTMEEMEQIVKKAQDVGALVVIDEAYHYFYPNTFLELIPRYDNVIILRTFSKLFSLAACRLGVAISNPDIIAVLSKANCSYNVNSIALKFAEELMKRPDLIQDLITIQLEGKAFLTNSLKEHGYTVVALEGNFIFVKPFQPAAEIARMLDEHEILVKTYGSGFLSDYLRISTGSRQAMEQFLEVFLKLDQIDQP